MALSRSFFCLFLLFSAAFPGWAVADEAGASGIHLELNTVQDTGSACRLTFVAQNQIGQDIEQAVFETVIFDSGGGVLLLSLFDFRDLPSGTPRVRQFDVPGRGCDALGRVLINGANTCTAGGGEIDACSSALSVSSRIDLELLG